MASKFRREVGRERYDVEDVRSLTFVRHSHMRTTSFEMRILDISHQGLKIVADSASFIDFTVGHVLMLTLDFNGKIFERPIHASYRIANVSKNQQGQTCYGLALVEVDTFHRKCFALGFENFLKATA